MSIESSLKALIQQKTGGYRQKHPIDDLCAEANALGLNFDPTRLAGFPNAREVIDRRYAQGTSEKIARTFSDYLLTLEIAKAAVEKMTRTRFGGASFEIQQPPWMRATATMQK